MERSIQKNGLINLLALLAVGVAAFCVARYTASLAGQVSVLFLGLGVLVAAVSWFQMHLEENVRLEKLEVDELAKSRGSAALFEAKDAELFPVRRSLEQFERFFVPLFTVVLALLQAGGAYLLWRWVSKANPAHEFNEPITALSLFALFALVLFLLGRFSATFARLENNRLLRPAASYVLLNAFLAALVAASIGAVWGGYARVDFFAAQLLCGLLALVSVETIIGLVLEVYRPRVKGRVQRPLYDSRLVGLLGQPEGLITTAAEALDYQFGFKVSETWFYQLFFQKALKWLLLGQCLVLVLSTCVVFIDAGEQGVLEHFGRLDSQRTPLQAGAHFKWPWPVDKVYRYRTEQIQEFELGAAPGSEGQKEAKVVVWTVSHTAQQEDNFLVANRDMVALTNAATDEESKRTPPVSLITGSLPVLYQITNVVSWVYTNEDSPSLLQDLARREVVRYFVGADMEEIMSGKRLEASDTLLNHIQTAADAHHMGVRLVSVGLQDMHPPVKVALDYEKVIAATQSKQAAILKAHAEEVRTNALAEAQAVTVVNKASAERISREIDALAQAALFTNQIPAYQAAPSVYVERAYLATFVRATANSRKYLLLTTNTYDVINFDLQNSVAGDMLGLNIPQAKK